MDDDYRVSREMPYIEIPAQIWELVRNNIELGSAVSLYEMACRNHWLPIRTTMTALAKEIGVGRVRLLRLVKVFQDEGLMTWTCKRGPADGELIIFRPV